MEFKEIIIIPDVHGRAFWKKALPDDIRGNLIVFLGDYLDPYENEVEVDWWSMWDRFQEIIELKKEYPQNVILLLGNHDLHYVWKGLLPQGSRYNEYQEEKIATRFKENWDCFQMAFECNIDGKRFLFSHAGLSQRWILNHPELFQSPDEVSAQLLNSMKDKESFIKALGDVSKYRGGDCNAGSLIWADRAEHDYSWNWVSDYIQIFGHTQGMEPRNSGDRAYCLDCRKAFRLAHDGTIQEI